MKVTREVLEYTGACKEGIEKFLALFPDGCEVTVENISKCREAGIPIWIPGANLYGANLSGAYLSGADLSGHDLEDLKKRGAIL